MSNPTLSLRELFLLSIPGVHALMCFSTLLNGTAVRAGVERSRLAYTSPYLK
jgi:hypothetical protein